MNNETVYFGIREANAAIGPCPKQEPQVTGRDQHYWRIDYELEDGNGGVPCCCKLCGAKIRLLRSRTHFTVAA